MNAILSADKNWGIGKDNRLLFYVPEDMKLFRETTMGGTLIMGRSTFESLPGKKPLPARRNIILSSSLENVEGAEVARGIPEVLSLISGEKSEKIFIMGGQRIYEQLLPLCDTAYVTKFDACAYADAFVPDLDKNPAWTCIYESEPHEHSGLVFRFTTYKNNAAARFV